MKSRLSIGLAAIGCLFLVSCYPWPEGREKKPQETVKKEPTLDELKAKKEQEARKKAEEEIKEKKEETTERIVEPPRDRAPAPEDPKPTVETKRNDYPFANKVPGKDGFVFSPYNQKVVDVRDIPSGTLVMDPTYPPSEKKYFRVP